MSDAAGDARFTIRPILVFRSKATRLNLKAAIESTPVIMQFNSAEQYAADRGTETAKFIVIYQTRAHL